MNRPVDQQMDHLWGLIKGLPGGENLAADVGRIHAMLMRTRDDARKTREENAALQRENEVLREALEDIKKAGTTYIEITIGDE